MYYQDFTTWSSMGKTIFEPLYEAQKVAMPFLEKLQRENIACISDNVAFGIEYIQSLNKANKVEDFSKTQLNCLLKGCEKNLQHGQNFMKILEEGVKEFRQNAQEKMSQIFTAEEEAPMKAKKSSHMQ